MANPNPKLPPSNTGKKYKREVQDPRVDMFKQFYLSPSSYTFMNIRRSALRAGYTDQYARNISVQKPGWWVELTNSAEFNRAEMLKSAENTLYNTIIDEPADANEKKLRHDASKFITERLGKDIYSTRQEVTGADGRQLFGLKERESKQVPLKSLFKGVKATDK